VFEVTRQSTLNMGWRTPRHQSVVFLFIRLCRSRGLS